MIDDIKEKIENWDGKQPLEETLVSSTVTIDRDSLAAAPARSCNMITSSPALPRYVPVTEFYGIQPSYSSPGISCWKENPSQIISTLRGYLSTWVDMNEKSKVRQKEIPTIGERFSQKFDEYIGINNVKNISKIEDLTLSEAIFEELVQREALHQCRTKEHSIVSRLLQLNSYSCDVSVIVSEYITKDGDLEWRTCTGNKTGSFVDLIQDIFVLPRQDALATVAKMVGMNYAHLHCLSSDILSAAHQNSRSHVDIPQHIFLHRLNSSAKLESITYIYGHANQVVSAIALYSINGNTICIPATVCYGELCIGKCKPTAYFMNQNIIDRYPKSIVVMCQDMRTAISLQNILKEVKAESDIPHFIVTSHLGDDLGVLPWRYIHRHDVIFIPAPDKHRMAQIKAYRDHVEGVNGQFRIYPGFLLHTRPKQDLSQTTDLHESEGELLRSSVILEDVYSPFRLLDSIKEKSMPYKEFIDWGIDMKIYKSNENKSRISEKLDCPPLPPVSPIMLPESAYGLDTVNIYHVMRPGSYVLLLGAKNSGKTRLALAGCSALLNGDQAWPFFKGSCLSDEAVCYVDAETPLDEYQENLKMSGLASKDGTRFWGLSKFASNLPEFCEDFSLNSEKFREGLFRYLRTNKCRFVILDNLIALMGDGVDYAKHVQDVLDWVKRLQSQGLCVVLIHHKTDAKSDIGRGSQNLYTLARTVISLIGAKEICTDSLGTETVKKAAAQPGLTVGIRYAVSKPAPILDQMTFWLHHPLGSGNWLLLDATKYEEKIELPSDWIGPEKQTSDDAVKPRQSELTEEERRVYEHAKKHGKIATRDASSLLGCGETTARQILQELDRKNLLIHNGEKGPASAYRFNREE